MNTWRVQELREVYHRVDQQTRGVLGILRSTIERFGEERGSEAAAGMTFYSLFSLFPLLLVLVATGSQVLHSPQAQEQVLDLVMKAFPFSVEIVEENIQRVLQARGSMQLVGILGLVWSASGAFTVLTRNINRAWPQANRHNFVKMRLMALIMVAGMVGVLAVLLVANTLTLLIPKEYQQLKALFVSLRFFSRGIISVLSFITFLWLYRWIPNTTVQWAEAAWGSLFATMSAFFVTTVFTRYLGSGLSHYNLVYGSLGAMVALMFWIYLISMIVLIGAHLSASIAQHTRLQPHHEGTEHTGS